MFKNKVWGIPCVCFILALFIGIYCVSNNWALAQEKASVPSKHSKILVLTSCKHYNNYSSLFGWLSKLPGISLQVGVKLETAYSVQEGYDGILFLSAGVCVEEEDAAVLMDIDAFVRRGKRAAIDLTFAGPDISSTLSGLYSFAISREDLKGQEKSLILDGGTLLPLWNGLKVGVGSNGMCGIWQYLSGDLGSGETTQIMSETSGKRRIGSLNLKIGNGETLFFILPSVSRSTGRSFSLDLPYSDSQIDRLDNEEAIKRLLKWIVKKD